MANFKAAELRASAPEIPSTTTPHQTRKGHPEMNIKTITTTIAAAVALTFAATGVAHADTIDPTAGDSVVYYLYADTHSAGASSWYDQNNDMQGYEHTNLPATSNLGHAYGTKRFVSASTYQLVGASIQTNGYYAGCRIEINGVVVDTENATGHYAVATCAA